MFKITGSTPKKIQKNKRKTAELLKSIQKQLEENPNNQLDYYAIQKQFSKEDEYNRITAHALILKKLRNPLAPRTDFDRSEKDRTQRLLNSMKAQTLHDNKKKMLEVQWRVKLAKISTEIQKEKVKSVGWKINQWYGGKHPPRYQDQMRSTTGALTRPDFTVSQELVGFKSNQKRVKNEDLVWKTTKNVSYVKAKHSPSRKPNLAFKISKKPVGININESRGFQPKLNRIIDKNDLSLYDGMQEHYNKLHDVKNGSTYNEATKTEESFYIPETPEELSVDSSKNNIRKPQHQFKSVQKIRVEYNKKKEKQFQNLKLNNHQIKEVNEHNDDSNSNDKVASSIMSDHDCVEEDISKIGTPTIKSSKKETIVTKNENLLNNNLSNSNNLLSLKHDDGDNPVINNNPSAINHPIDDPEDEIQPSKRIYQVPNQSVDDPRLYIDLQVHKGLGDNKQSHLKNQEQADDEF